MIHIRKSIAADADEIWDILQPIIREGDSFVYSPSSTKEEMLGYWLDKKKHTYTALINDKIVGTFFIQDNQPGSGSHIANAGYATCPKPMGKASAKKWEFFHWKKHEGLDIKPCNLISW